MPIVSVSLDDEIMQEADRLIAKKGYKGRSEIVRAGLRNLIADSKQLESVQGKITCVLMIVHKDKYEDFVSRIKHKFESLVITHLHSTLQDEKCLDVFIISGNADKIKLLVNSYEISRKINYIKAFVP